MALRLSVGTGDSLTLITRIGEPSVSNCSSYFLPVVPAELQEMLETWPLAKFPSCLHIPVDNSTSGAGRPSTFGRSLDLSSIRSTDNSYRSSCYFRPFSPENVT